MENIKLIKKFPDLYFIEYNGDEYEFYYQMNEGFLKKINPDKKSYTLPKEITYEDINYEIFIDYHYPLCYNKTSSMLEEVIIEQPNKYYSSENGVLYKRGEGIILYPRYKKDEVFAINTLFAPHCLNQFSTNKFLKVLKYRNRTFIKNNNDQWKLLN